MKELIICAAIKIESTGKTYRGHRHNHCFTALNDELSWTLTRQEISKLNKLQGFITNYNRFVDRKEALKIALKADQIIDKSKVGRELFSEDLY